jgi:hypothetical protein
MTKNQPVVIERVANGFLVRAEREPGMTVFVANIQVFQRKGSASSECDCAQETLLTWLEKHFDEGDK